MAKYKADGIENITSLDDIKAMFEMVIKNETGATAEVTINTGLMVYTEDLDKANVIKALVSSVKEFERESRYEADEDFPAGVTMFFKM